MQAESHLQRAQMAHRAGRLQVAEHHYRQALHIRADLAEVNFSLAAVLMLQGKLDEALVVARAGVKAGPTILSPIAGWGTYSLFRASWKTPKWLIARLSNSSPTILKRTIITRAP
jgi:hypothetical protein